VRPTQCRTFPFWREYIESAKGWERVACRCPGVDRGRLYTVEEIEQLALATDT
jgi:Fe-S-cluster containining protein